MIIDGKYASSQLFEKLKLKIEKLDKNLKLVAIQIGEIPASTAYINIKKKKTEKFGIQFEHIKLNENCTEEEVISTINNCNSRTNIGGIILQLPLPSHLNPRKLIDCIDPKKDIDCLTSVNLGKFFAGDISHLPATPLGVIRLLEFYNIEIEGKDICVIGKSNLVGKPLSVAFMNKDASVTVCHTKTKNIEKYSRLSDIVVIAAGAPKFFDSKYFNSSQTVIDVGITTMNNGNISGDVNFEEVSKIVKDITPVPGGVGPMTVYGLIENFVNLNSKSS